MAGLAGILGSAMGGAVDVLAPVVQSQAIEKLRAEIQAKRDAALFAQEQAIRADDRAFTGEQNELNREIDRERLGLIEQEMSQSADQFNKTFEQRGAQHSAELEQRGAMHDDEMALSREKLELLKTSGGSQTQSGDMQMISFLQNQLGKTPEEAFEMWKATKNDPKKFIQQYVLSAMRSQDELGALTGESKTPEQMAEEGLSVYQAIMGEEKPADSRGGAFKFLGFEE